MSRITDVIRQIKRNNKSILRRIQEDEEYIKQLYRSIQEDLISIAETAHRKKDVTNIMGELQKYIEELEELGNNSNNPVVRGHISSLVTRIKIFMKEYREAALGGAFAGLDDKINAFTVSITNALRETILKDLGERYSQLKRAESGFRHAA